MRRIGVVSLLVAALAFTVAAGGEPARDITKGVARSRAIDAYSAMQRYFYSRGDGSYAGSHERPNRAQAWPFSQALWATLEIASIRSADSDAHADLLARIRALAADSRPEAGWPAEYAPVFGGSGVVYNDDNLWIAQALVGSSRIVGGEAYQTARKLFLLVEDSWDANAADQCPGGVFWTRLGANRDRNAVTTANASLLALRLYERSGSTVYLDWARQAYAWTKRCLGTRSGLVNDHIDLGGRVDRHTWSYNQGAMIAAVVRLYRATGRRAYLDDAKRTANAALRQIGDPIASGELPVFLAIFYRDLLELTAAVPGRVDRDAVSAFADEAWQRNRDAKTGLFHFAGRGPTLLDQAAMVQVYAELVR